MGTLRINESFSFVSGDDSYSPPRINNVVTVSGNKRMSGVASIGTTEETLPLGDIATVGWVVIRNLDSTNFITIGTTTGQLGMKLKAGESCSFRASANNIYLKADTAACNVSYDIFSD